MTEGTRARMVRGAARMVATRGPGRTSLRDLAKESGVPLGSTYHYFPGGKQQLVEEAVRLIGERVTHLIASSRENGPEVAIDAVTDGWRTTLDQSDFHTGCAVLAAATDDDPELGSLAREIFAGWETQLVEALVDTGVDRQRAPRLARMIVASLEGAVALSRAQRSTQPLDDVAGELQVLIRSAVSAT